MTRDDRRLSGDDVEVAEGLHEMMGPLAAIRSLLEILRDHPDVPAAQRDRYVRMALEDCRRLQNGIQDVLGITPITMAGSRGGPERSG